MNAVLSPVQYDVPEKRSLPGEPTVISQVSADTNPPAAPDCSPNPSKSELLPKTSAGSTKPQDHPAIDPDQAGRTNTSPAGTNWPAWIFGGLLILFFMCVIWFKPQEQFSAEQQKLLRILASVFVGVISGFFTGSLGLEGKIPNLKDVQIGAIGGFAGFALTFFLW
jgi:hypothetical protein